MLWLCFKLPSCLFGNTSDTSVMHEKVRFVCFNYMQPQKGKFKSVQMNMKHVSYIDYFTQFNYINGRICAENMNTPVVILKSTVTGDEFRLQVSYCFVFHLAASVSIVCEGIMPGLQLFLTFLL